MFKRQNDSNHQHKNSDALARRIVTACECETVRVQEFSEQDYGLLPPFNWDVSDHEECAAFHLMDQAITILHVASVFDGTSLAYRAKILFPATTSVLQSPDYDGNAFSVSFRCDVEGSWTSDSASELEKSIAEVLSKNTALTSLLVSSGHHNVNLWLEDFKPISYMAVNTGKRYFSATETIDFIKVCNDIAGIIRARPGLV